MTRPSRAGWLWLGLALLWHALGLAAFVNWREVLANPPLHYVDYATHYAAVESVSHFLDQGQLWGYDPFFHAGTAAGTLFDLDNKAIELASYGLTRLGVARPVAFNVVVLSLLAIAPFAVYMAARRLGLTPAAAGVAQCLMLAIWYGDETTRWMWQGSLLSFAAAALGSLWVGAAFWGWTSHLPHLQPLSQQERGVHSIISGVSPSPRRGEGRGEGRVYKPLYPLIWLLPSPLLFWIHPGVLLTLAPLIGVGLMVSTLQVRSDDLSHQATKVFTTNRWRVWAILGVWIAWTVLVNWPWLNITLRFLHTRTATDIFLQGGLEQLRYDVRAPHFALRLAILALAFGGLWRWAHEHRREWGWVATCVILWLVVAYAGAQFGLGAAQPYRLVMPALALATLPAADGLVHWFQWSPRQAGVAALAVCLALAPALYHARPQGKRLQDGTPSDHLSGPQPAEWAVCQVLQELDLRSGRVLTNEWRLGAFLPTCSGAQVVGGPFSPVWTVFGYVNADYENVLGRPVRELSTTELGGLLAQYNVRWVVINTGFAEFFTLADWVREHPGLLIQMTTHEPFVIYSVDQPATWFFEGAGHVVATYNRLVVQGASPGGVVLKYHWVESLKVDPPLPLRPVFVGHDPVPFIAVDNDTLTDFVIEQSYE